MSKTVMTRNDILKVFRDLANSQGFYGRLLRALENAKKNDYEAYDAYMTELESKNFTDAVDLILYIEC